MKMTRPMLRRSRRSNRSPMAGQSCSPMGTTMAVLGLAKLIIRVADMTRNDSRA
jgi:hypothetical protein